MQLNCGWDNETIVPSNDYTAYENVYAYHSSLSNKFPDSPQLSLGTTPLIGILYRPLLFVPKH